MQLAPALLPEQLQLGLEEPGLYLRSSPRLRRQTHFAVLWRDPALKDRARKAKAELNELERRQQSLHGFANDEEAAQRLKRLKRVASHDKRQACYPVQLLPEILGGLPTDRDTWISQSLFFTPTPGAKYRANRRKVNFASTSCVFVDFDYYSTPYRNDPDRVLQMALDYLDDWGKPHPSVVVYSGRGLHLKWLLDDDDNVPRPALVRWEALERHLVSLFACRPEFGVDSNCRDASRVLRLERTVNEKTGKIVEVLWVNRDAAGDPVRYAFGALCDAFLPFTRSQIQIFREADMQRELAARDTRREYEERGRTWADDRAANEAIWQREREAQSAQLKLIHGGTDISGLRRFSGRELAWHRLGDLQLLAELRGWDTAVGGAGVPHGSRSRFALYGLSFLALSGDVHAGNFWPELGTFVKRYTPDLLAHRDDSVFSTLFHKVQAFGRGETIEYDGEKYVPIYTPRNQTLIELFRITDEEQRRLATIISKDEARRRERERDTGRRRAAGALPRDEYLAGVHGRQERAKALRAEGKSISEIVLDLQCSRSAVKNYLRPK